MFEVGDKVTLSAGVYVHWKLPLGTVMEILDCWTERRTCRVTIAGESEETVGSFWVDMVNMIPVEAKKGDPEKPKILDSGERTEYSTGAVRDCKEGKGRCDLMPLDVLAYYLTEEGAPNQILLQLCIFQESGDVAYLFQAMDTFNESRWRDTRTMILEVSKHFEEGAKKYGPNNWQKGIPIHSYIDSAVRHYLKWLRGDTDEPHDRAFVWNLLCCAWTMKHHPELDDHTLKEEGMTDG